MWTLDEFFVVEFLAVKSTYHYVGQVSSEEKSADCCAVIQFKLTLYIQTMIKLFLSFPKNEDKSWHFMSEIR